MSFSVLLISALIVSTLAQDCNVTGETCSDDQNCCGGCCVGDVCMQDNQPCNERDDPCLTYPCSGNTKCVMYQAPDCSGCTTYPICQEQSETESPY